jgi:hypothetical protein
MRKSVFFAKGDELEPESVAKSRGKTDRAPPQDRIQTKKFRSRACDEFQVLRLVSKSRCLDWNQRQSIMSAMAGDRRQRWHRF